MADNTKIEWTDATWNPVTGCSVVSPGCTNCYAMRLAGTRMKHHPSRAGLTEPSKAGPVWNGQVRFNKDWLDQPLKWTRPRRIFVCAHGDLFHENVPNEWIYAVLAVMAATYDVAGTDDHNVINAYRQRHVYQVLTKRQARMRALMSDLHAVPKKPGLDALLDHPLSRSAQTISRAQGHPFWMNAPLSSWQWVIDGCPGLWLGVSVEDQARADERIPELLATPAAVRFLSCEPLLGRIDLTEIDLDGENCINALRPETPADLWRMQWSPDATGMPLADCIRDFTEEGFKYPPAETTDQAGIDWVIAGGESGPGARPMHPDWARSLRDQCEAAGLPFFFKQHGDWIEFRQAGGHAWSNRSKFDRHGWRKGKYLGELSGGQLAGRVMESHSDGEGAIYVRPGKAAAGRLLDGREHSEFPA